MKGKIKKISITAVVILIGFIIGIAMPIVVKGENGDATSAQVLAEKTFTSSLVSVATSGEMKNLSGKTYATNNPGVSTIDVDDGYYTEIQVDASAVYDAGYEAGEAESAGNIREYKDGNSSYTFSNLIIGKQYYLIVVSIEAYTNVTGATYNLIGQVRTNPPRSSEYAYGHIYSLIPTSTSVTVTRAGSYNQGYILIE